MNNRILHLISNRPGPFLTPLFGQDPTFVAQQIPVDEQVLRTAMFLDKTDTDYYLKVYLAVLNAYPDWKQQFGLNLQESFAVEELMPRGVYMQGGDLLSYAGGPGLFTDPPLNPLPVELHYRIQYLAADLCQIIGLETGVQYNATVNVTGSDPAKILRITWPAAVPFIGALQLSQPWMLGAVVDIFVQPSNFPFAQLIANIRGNGCLQSLLATYDIVADFNEDMDPMEQTAMAVTVIGLANLNRLMLGRSSLATAINSDVPGWLSNVSAA